jgi:hypothetical protein
LLFGVRRGLSVRPVETIPVAASEAKASTLEFLTERNQIQTKLLLTMVPNMMNMAGMPLQSVA